MMKCPCKECVSEQVCDNCLKSFVLGTMLTCPVYRDKTSIVRKRYYCTETCATRGEIQIELMWIEEQKKHINIDIAWIQSQWMRQLKVLRPN